MATNKTYNGWKNWNQWNIALWINNDESLYRLAQQCVSDATEAPRKQGESVKDLAAKMFFVSVADNVTPDGAPYTVTNIKAAIKDI